MKFLFILILLLFSVNVSAQSNTDSARTTQVITPGGPRATAARVSNASYYAPRLEGRLTASGQRYVSTRHTAAHRTLRFGTRVEVTNLANGRSVVVIINDRGPFIRGRDLDLSASAMQALGGMRSGVIRVRYRVL